MSCVFCAIVAGDLPAALVAETPGAIAFLDTRPVFKGHVLVIPRAHVPDLVALPEADLGPLLALARRLAAAQEQALGAEGAFLGLNHRISQSVPHLHLHVIPRRKGDGLRGFFWPRVKYASDAEAAEVAGRLRAALTSPR